MSAPFVSVVLPVYNGERFLERAVDSARRQTFTEWELLAVDDGSSDASPMLLQRLAALEPRLRVLRRSANGGVSAARNTALRDARGEWVAYLDCDDEFYPDYLQRVFASRNCGDVLVFAYDLLEERPGLAQSGQTSRWYPHKVADRLMLQHIAVPLGVAHRRGLLQRVGLFDESLRRDEDSDLWRRFAQSGAVFHFLPAKSGLYHVRGDSLSRTTAPVTPATPRLAVLELTQGSQRYLFRVQQREIESVRDILERHEYGDVPPRLLRRPPTIVDIGANVGAFCVYCKLHYHAEAIIHAFEPHPTNLELLRQNTAPFAGVRIHPVALLKEESLGGRDAGMVWDELALTEVDIFKVTSEGNELAILEGLGQRLRSIRFVLARFQSRRDRRLLDSLLEGFELFGIKLSSIDDGVVKYARADLVRLKPPQPPASPPD